MQELTIDKVSSVHTNQRRPFRPEFEVLSAIDLDEYYVDTIVGHEEKGRNPTNWKFKKRWIGYEPEDNSWLNWIAVKDLATLDSYSKEHLELKLD